MKNKLLRAVAGILAVLVLVALPTGCGAKTKPAISTALQMNNAAFTIGVDLGSTAVDAVRSELPKAEMKYVNRVPDAYLAVSQGKLDAFAYDRYLLEFAIANGLTGFRILPDDIGEGADVAIGISRKTEIPELEQKINDFLAQLRADGTLDEMFQRWVEDANDTMPDIPKPEHPSMALKVGTSGLVQPFSYYKGDEVTGFDLELIARLALFLNADVELKVLDYYGLPSAAEAGTIDCILANLNATAERRETMDFSTPIYKSRTALLVKDDSAAGTANTPLETAAYGVMTGSIAETYIEETYPNAKINTYNSIPDAFLACSSGKIDYVMTAYTTALTAVKNNRALMIDQNNVTENPIACAVSKDNPELRKKIDNVLSKFQSDGTLDAIIANWTTTGQDYVLDDVPVSSGENGVLRVAIAADREPMCFVMDDTYRGLDCELARRIAYELGMTVEFQNMQFTGLIAALKSGKADVIVSNMSPTAERAESVDFTQPYFSNPQVLLARRVSEAAAQPKDPADATYGITSIVAQDYLGANYPEARFSMFPSATDAMLALQNGKVDYVMTSHSTALYMMKRDANLTIEQDHVVDEACYIAVSKERPDLKEDVNAVLSGYKEDGTLDELNARWVAGGPDYYRTVEVPQAEGKNGVLKVALSPDVPPICFLQDGEPAGIDVELIQRIAYDLDKKVEFSTMDIDALLPAIQSGKVDLALSDLNATDERRELVDFTQSYFDNPQVILALGSGEPVVRSGSVEESSFWDGLKASFTRTFITENRWKLVLDGLWITVLISICSGLIGSILGFGICMLRRSKKRAVSFPAAAFIRIIQGTPIVVLLMILYYIIFGKVDIPAILVAILGFSVNFSVYVSEMMRTSIDAVDKGQIEAAHALGFTRIRTFWKITFPQAARHFLPVFKGEFISMVKMTSVVGYIAIQDLTKVSDIIRSRTMEAFFPLIATAILYFLVANVLTVILSRLEISLDPKRRARTVKGVVMK